MQNRNTQIQDHRVEYRGSIKALCLDEETGRVRFSYESVGHIMEDYIPLESVKEKTLPKSAVKKLKKLLEAYNWVKRPVVAKDQVFVSYQSRYDSGDTRYGFTGSYEEWIAHRACSQGGHSATPTWVKIEWIVEYYGL